MMFDTLRQFHAYTLLALLITSVSITTAATSRVPCSFQRVQASSTSDETKLVNSVWPAGISDDDVDHLVEEVMQDNTITLPCVPNAIERQIYRSTIKVCWNAIYQFLGGFQGKQLFGHEFQLDRWKAKENSPSMVRQKQLISEQYRQFQNVDAVDEVVLELVARRLLDNKAINQRFLPDILERRLYVNCLKLIFRLLTMIAASLRIVVCGHEIRLHLSKTNTLSTVSSAFFTPAIQRVASSMTHIDKARLAEFAMQAGIHEVELGKHETRSGSDVGGNGSRHGSWIERLVDRRRRALLIHVHAALFGLILGVLDDLLANTCVELLSDRITFDIVPATDATSVRAMTKLKQTSTIKRVFAGIGFGLTAVLIIFGGHTFALPAIL